MNRGIINDKEVNLKKAKEILDKTNGVLLDVRSHQEYNEEHLPGAININLYDLKKEILKEESRLAMKAAERLLKQEIQLRQLRHRTMFIPDASVTKEQKARATLRFMREISSAKGIK